MATPLRSFRERILHLGAESNVIGIATEPDPATTEFMIIAELPAQSGALADPPFGDQRGAVKMTFRRKPPTQLAAQSSPADAAVAEQGGFDNIGRIRAAPAAQHAPIHRTGDGKSTDRRRDSRICLEAAGAAAALLVAALEMHGQDCLAQVECMVERQRMTPAGATRKARPSSSKSTLPLLSWAGFRSGGPLGHR